MRGYITTTFKALYYEDLKFGKQRKQKNEYLNQIPKTGWDIFGNKTIMKQMKIN